MDRQMDPKASQMVQPLQLFEILVRENADALTAFLRSGVADKTAVDDLFQETMLVAWRRIAEYDRQRPFGAWLRGIARNVMLAHFRKTSRQTPWPDEAVLNCIDQRLSQIDRRPGDTFDEKIEALKDCLERLGREYRQPIDLHYWESKTTEWIANCLATTKDAIQKRLQRARSQLADCLERKGVLGASGAGT
jgi:RNA polymerase sigma-70 factor (ECF subfamily)